MYFFTADEHYGHKNIIRYCKRPFTSVDEMDAVLIQRHNEVVQESDTIIHAGDFTLAKKSRMEEYRKQLIGKHIFLMGSHDKWTPPPYIFIWEKNIANRLIVVCHYAMRTWPKSHYDSWQLYGHSHGTLEPRGKQWDIGVDNNDYYPVSFDQLVAIMKSRPHNPGFIKRTARRM